MRTVELSIAGQERILCFSVRVMRACTERYGSFAGVYKAMAAENETECLDSVVWLLAQMMQAGDRYAKANEMDNPAPLSEDDLLDHCDLSDFVQLRGTITQAISAGNRTNIEVEPGKNGEATQENQPLSG